MVLAARGVQGGVAPKDDINDRRRLIKPRSDLAAEVL